MLIESVITFSLKALMDKTDPIVPTANMSDIVNYFISMEMDHNHAKRQNPWLQIIIIYLQTTSDRKLIIKY